MNLLECLEYPLDNETILRKKRAIRKRLLTNGPKIEKNIAILGGSTTAEIKNILDLFLLKLGIKASFYESEYNRYYEDALFGKEHLGAFNPDVIYIHTTQVNLLNTPEINDTEAEIENLLAQELERYKVIWAALSDYDCAIIQNNFDLPLDRSLGNLDSSDCHGKTHFIQRLNMELANQARRSKNLYINDINYLSAFIGIQQWFDKQLWYIAKYAISYYAIPVLAHNLGHIINAIFGQTKKCLVLDLDNTCWGGVIGDDGAHGIQLGPETALGEAYSGLQKYAKDLQQRGVILAVCSKNDYQIAAEGFTHSDSILKLDDFSAFMANWEPKHQNIKAIAKEINIGLDSLVFIDDNPVEREIVASQTPDVAVPDIGENIVNYVDFIDKSGYFEAASLSQDDLGRSAYYQQNRTRQVEQESFKDYTEFLCSLEMKAEIKTFTSLYLDRITQLINKTNQFNFTTRRYTLGEIEELSGNDAYIKLYGRLVDKYGDNGLVAIMIASIQGMQCHIDLWLMSCRVLKRDLELAMFDSLVDCCREQGLTEIIGYYFQTPKNHMVAGLYPQLGFVPTVNKTDASVWKLSLEHYKKLNTTIKVEND